MPIESQGNKKSRGTRRWVKIFFALMLLLALGFGGYHLHSKGKAGEEKKYTIAKVETGDIEEVVTAQGKLEPKEYVDVGVQVSGQIKKIFVELGDVVKKGDPIAEIDPKIYESKVEADEARIKTLEAQLAQQEAQVKLAELQFNRSKQLIESKAVSRDVYESAETALVVAQAEKTAVDAQLEEARSTLDGDKANLGYTKIFAPIDGTIVIVDAKEGQTLNAAQSAPRVVQIAKLDILTARAQVAEADIMRITPGVEVYFTTLGGQGRKWKGTVRQVLPSPEVVNEVVLYNVLLDVDNADRALMTGMSAQMFFVMGRVDQKPLVPIAALGRRLAKDDTKDGKAYRVLKVVRGKNTETTVRVGLMNRVMAEVKDGLSSGDEVAIETSGETDDKTNAIPRRMRNMGGRL
ncbi:MAG: efflux RND transporter periplasmic adaptor subunit [Alphaproteobacteria bacterium]